MTVSSQVEDGIGRGAGPQVHFDFAPLPAILRRVARQSPQRVALVDGSISVTYDELLLRVDQLANHLVESGCQPGSRVAALIPRSLDAVVAQCAIMTAGAVYVPFDPTYPPALLAALFDGANIDHAVGTSAGLTGLQTVNGQPLTSTEIDDAKTAAAIARASNSPCAVDLAPSDGAYILHTSGTTGRPKGALVTHGAAVNAIKAWRYHYGQHPITGFLMVSPLTFDGAFGGIWWTFAETGTVVLAPTDVAELVTTVRQTVERSSHPVSHTFMTPTLYRQALQDIRSADTTLKQVIVGGEACPQTLVQTHYRLMPDVDLVNIYGPTETTIWCTTAVLRPEEPVVVGKPLVNVEILLLDPDSGQPALGNEVGEVCIAGAQVADGYVGDEALTTQKFVQHPYRPHTAMYRSGDLGQWCSDGSLDLVGRIDSQIQVRGQRVELAGIREQLGQCAGVADVVVAMHEKPGDRGQKSGGILTAYVVPELDKTSVDGALKSTWQQIYDDLAAKSDKDPTFDTTGWNSSYSGLALSDEDMVEWVDTTVALMRETNPSTVADLGCGTGMPLLRVAPHCRRYVGLDPSERTITNLGAAARRAGLRHVQLQVGVATDIDAFAGQGFDLVVCNSVTQYFPGVDYQARVLKGALDAVAEGGRVIIGDVRDLSLQTEFHSAVLAVQCSDQPLSDLSARVLRRIAEDREFVIDPRWFEQAVGDRADTVLEVRPRRGRRHNEMTAFRFDVVIHCGATAEPVEISRWYDWTSDGMDSVALQTILASRPDSVGVRAVPNARTQHAIAAAAEIFASQPEMYGFGQRIAADGPQVAVEPEDIYALANEAGYQCHLSRLAAHPGGALDVALLRSNDRTVGSARRIPLFGPIDPMPDGTPLATEPRRHQVLATARTAILPTLRRHAAEHLPAHERPDAYVVLSELPVTSNGKVDLAALPAPSISRPELANPYRPPVSATERTIARVWADVLGIEQIGTLDEFTELGGDSLQAARVAILLTRELGITVSAGTLMAAGTIRELVGVVVSQGHITPVQHGQITPAPAVEIAESQNSKRLPLTEVQNLFWLLEHFARPGASSDDGFVVPTHYEISGPLNVSALSAAVDQLVERHEALRVKLFLDAADGAQEVMEARPGWLHFHAAAEAGPGGLPAVNSATTSLDSRAGRVFAAQLYATSEHHHLLTVEVHHMVSDAWSIGIIEEELSELYDAAITGRSPRLDAAPSYSQAVSKNYRQFTLDMDWRNSPAFQRALDYWSPIVSGAVPFRLPGTRERNSAGLVGLCSAVLTADEHDAVTAVTRAHRGTIFTTVLGCLGYVLATDTGSGDARLLSINAARDSVGTEGLLGFVANPFLVRFQTTPGATFGSVLSSVATAARGALAHSDVPLVALCEEFPELIDVLVDSDLVIVESVNDAVGLTLTGCTTRRVDFLEERFTGLRPRLPSEIVLVIRQEGAQLRLAALYNTSALDEEYMHGLMERLRHVLVAGSADPEQLIGDLIRTAPMMGTTPSD